MAADDARAGLSEAARRLVERHRLAPHPEGGWYRRVVESRARTDTRHGERPAVTSILYLLGAGDVSRPHRVSNDEVWHFLAGDPLQLAVFDGEGGYSEVVLGDGGDYVHCVPGGAWQAARCLGLWTLAGCTVAPGFDFADFEMADGAALEALLAEAPRLARFVR